MPRVGQPGSVAFRDKQGKFVKHSERFTDKVFMLQAYRSGQMDELSVRDVRHPKPGPLVTPEHLATLLVPREYESLGEATLPIASFESGSKYKAWDIAEQIDQMKGIRRKDLKLNIVIQDGDRERTITMYHKIKGNGPSSYRLFQRFNEEIGFEGYYLYKTAGGKIIADRRGRKVSLKRIDVEEIV